MNDHITIDGMQGAIRSNGMIDFRNDDRVNVLFYKKSVLDPVRSRELGRPHHVARDYVRIQQPGEKDYADRPVSDDMSVTVRWPHHWSRYQANQQQIPAGTPLECLFPNQPEIPANLHTLAVHTVEQLAHLTAEGLSQVGMGAQQWQTRARAFLASSRQGVEHHQLQKELESRDTQIEVLTNQLAIQQRQIDRLLADKQGVPEHMLPTVRQTQSEQFTGALPPPVPAAPMFDDAAATAEFGGEASADPAPPAPATVTAAQIESMNRAELFAYLKSQNVPAPGRSGDDTLRAAALATISQEA